MSAEKKDTHRVSAAVLAESRANRRQSRLAVPTAGGLRPNSSVSGVAAVGAFETVDELDALDQKYRKPSVVSSGNAGRGRKLSRMPSAGTVNPVFDTVDELDDLDVKYRKPSLAQPPSRAGAASAPGKTADAKEEKEYYFKKRCGTSTKVLLTLSIMFFLTTEIMVSVYLMEIYRVPDPQICETEACINAGKLFSGSLDTDVDPCKDFYSYACGNFQRHQPYGEWYRNLDDLVTDELIMRMNDLLRTLRSNSNQTYNEDYERKAAQFYDLCMDTNSSLVPEKLIWVLRNLSWPLMTDDGIAPPSLLPLLKDAHQHGIHALFHISRLPDIGHPETPFWTLQEGSLSLARSVYDSKPLLDQYHTFITKMIQALSTDSNSVQVSPDDKFNLFADIKKAIVEFETQLSQVSHEFVFFKVSLEEFSNSHQHIAKFMNMTEYLSALSDASAATANETVTGKTIIIIKNLDYFDELNKALEKMTDRDQAIYLGWRILFQYVELLSEEPQFWSIIQGFWKSIGTESQPQWKKCTRLALESLPTSGLAIYTNSYFPPEHNKQVELILDKLKETAWELVDKQEWIDPIDKKVAEDKFKNLTRQLPFSEELFAKNLTNQLYSECEIHYDSFFWTLRRFQRVRQNFVINGLYNTPIKYTDLLSFAFGADYRLEHERSGVIGVFPKTFVAPFYDDSYPAFAQYASLGFVYGRELAHVIDYQWFNLHNSTVEDGPTNRTLEAYHSRQGSLLELYRNVSVQLGVPNDYETLYEDIADQAALRMAFRAYQKVIKDSNDMLFPGIRYVNYSFPQIFFISYAQQFCENKAAIHVENIPHVGFSKPEIRLTATVQNSEEFSKAFNCPAPLSGGEQLFDIPNPPRKLRYQKGITAKQIDEWYHWYDRKPGVPTWSKAW